MKFKIILVTVITVIFISCNSLKIKKNNDIITNDVSKNKDIINQIADEVTIEDKVLQNNSVLNSMVTLTVQQQQGKDLYENKCGNCHNLYQTKSFSKEDWKPILLRMQLQAEISDAERENIYTYLMM